MFSQLNSLELARQLQLEERHAAEAEAETVERETSAASSQQSPATGQRSPPPQSSKKKDVIEIVRFYSEHFNELILFPQCTIL